MINLPKYLPLGLSASLKWFRNKLASTLLMVGLMSTYGILPLLYANQLLWLYLLAMIISIVLLGITIHLYDKLNCKERELKQSVDDFNFVNKRLHDFYPEFDMEHEKEFNKGWDSAK